MSRTGLFSPATNDQAFLKATFLGDLGSGKTYTASRLACGMYCLLRDRGLIKPDTPALFSDTEKGSGFVLDHFAEHNVPVETSNTRSFDDLLAMANEAHDLGTVWIIDSLTHFAEEYISAWQKRNNVAKPEAFDYGMLRGPEHLGKFSLPFLNGHCHIIACGRLSYDYETRESDAGVMESYKSGVKLKGMPAIGYEPHLCVSMSRREDIRHKAVSVSRVASIIKDRCSVLDGKEIVNPTFESFLPHIERLNLGGKHEGVDDARSSAAPYTGPKKSKRQEVQVVLDEIQSVITKHYPGTTKDEKRVKMSLIEEAFSTPSWERVGTLPLEELKDGRNKLWLKLEKKEYGTTVVEV